jgi:hypothetical protein
MLKVYRYLTYLFVLLLIAGLVLSLYEYFIVEKNYKWEAVPINLLILYVLVSTLYFVRKTQNTYEISNSNLVNNPRLEANYRLDKYFTISNLLVGLGLTIFALYIMLFYPMNAFDLEEFLRFLILLLMGVYGVLKIRYSINYLKQILRKK